MGKYKIASIISYSSYHNPYIERVIEEAKKVSDYVIVMSHSHFYDGQDDAGLIKSPLNVDHTIIKFKRGHESRWYHNDLRRRGYEIAVDTDNFDAVFFIDSDEVLEGDRVKEWVESEVQPGENYKLSHGWYYRDTCYMATTLEEGAVLVSRQTLESPEMNWFGNREREDFTKNWNYMASYQNKKLGHHYSWAGTKEMILKKVSSWGHNKDAGVNWVEMVENEYSHKFNGRCPFKDYNFIKVEPYVGFTFET